MASFLKALTKSDPNAAYALSPDVLQASATLGAALDARVRADNAVARNASDRLTATEARIRAGADLDSLTLELALSIDEANTLALKARIAAARTMSQEAASALEEAERLKGALYVHAKEIDTQIADAHQVFQTAMGTFAREVNEALAEEARAASKPLEVVLKRAHATAFAIGNLSHSHGFLSDVLLPSPVSPRAIISGSRISGADESFSDLINDWRDDPTAAALAEMMGQLTALKRRVALHRAFVPPAPPAKPSEVSQANRSAIEYNKAIDEREAARAAGEPKPAPVVLRSGTYDFNPHHTRP